MKEYKFNQRTLIKIRTYMELYSVLQQAPFTNEPFKSHN